MATDGGAKAFKGSHVFVITNPESKVLISWYGQTADYDLLSFPLEASTLGDNPLNLFPDSITL